MARGKRKTVPDQPIVVVREETNRDRFLRIGQHRMENALRGIRLLGNLSAQNYECTEAEVSKMYTTLQAAIEEVFARFAKARPRKLEENFRLVDVKTEEVT